MAWDKNDKMLKHSTVKSFNVWTVENCVRLYITIRMQWICEELAVNSCHRCRKCTNYEICAKCIVVLLYPLLV